eukprot:scaffold3273_cov244-Pinguiococcus_pyrenoidosus.AAC.2
MAKKKKGKKDKKGPSKTPEELELERQKMVEEMRRAAIETRRTLSKQLELEISNSRVNRMKIHNQWRKIMRIAKVETLRKDIEILSQNHERDVDRKDAIIQMLDRDLMEAEDQFQMALRAHLHNLEDLVDLHDERLFELESRFQEELEELSHEHQAEKERMGKTHDADVQEFNDIIAAIEAEEAERETEAKQEHDSVREDIKNRNSDDLQLLRMTLDQRIEELEQSFESAHLTYLQNTDSRTTEFKQLTHRDSDLSREIDIKMRRIERLKSNVRHWSAKIHRTLQESAERNKLLLDERNAIQRHFQKLKGRVARFRNSQAQRIAELTQNANASILCLKDRRGLAEKLLKLGEISRKLETEKEKVLPFFQRKFNKVALDVLAIRDERRRLQQEHHDLESVLRQYLDGISVVDDGVSTANQTGTGTGSGSFGL